MKRKILSITVVILILLISAIALIGCGIINDNKEPADSGDDKPIPVDSIQLSESKIEMFVGDLQDLVATVLPENAADKSVHWESSNPEVASVAVNGRVRAEAAGTAVITARAGEKTATCQVTVSTPVVAVESVELDKAELSLVVGAEQALNATVLPENATERKVTWISSNTTVATVDENGNVTALAEGSAVITANAGDKTATCQVTVSTPVVAVESVELDKTELSLVVGEYQKLTATILPENATDKKVVWSSSNPEVATIDENGNVAGVAEGTAVISVTVGIGSATCQVTVELPAPTECLTYEEILENGKAVGYTVTGLTDKTVEKVVIPAKYNGLPVLRIGNSAFSECSMKDIILPDSVTTIRNYAFEYCRGLTSLTIPNSVTSLGNYAFYECTELTSLTIPNGLTTIGTSMFWNCSGLTSMTIPNSVTSIGNNAFYGCSGLISVTMPNKMTSIGNQAFYGCTGLLSVTIPDSVTSIGNQAFSGCSGLTSISIPNSVTKIGTSAFLNCSGLTNIMVGSGNTTYHSEGNCLIETSTKTLVLGCQTSIIPTDGSVTVVGKSAFQNCSGLTSITIPNSVTSIGRAAFSCCSGLTSITIPSSVTSIGNDAFDRCGGLTSVTIEDGVASIGNYSFYGCVGLVSMTIPSSVTSIGSQGLSYCSILETINYGGTVEQWQQITKGSGWDANSGEYAVVCTDGTIAKDGTVTQK